MLAMDGHIQLADMGGVGDSFGDMSARKVRFAYIYNDFAGADKGRGYGSRPNLSDSAPS